MKQRILTILCLVLLLNTQVWGQNVPSGLINAIAKGDASGMSAHFHQSLELSILDKEYETSKAQGTRIMENFFKEHKPSGFKISFEGDKEQSKYAIGSLKTGKGNFRVNLFFMNRDGKQLIYYINIEKETSYEIRP